MKLTFLHRRRQLPPPLRPKTTGQRIDAALAELEMLTRRLDVNASCPKCRRFKQPGSWSCFVEGIGFLCSTCYVRRWKKTKVSERKTGNAPTIYRPSPAPFRKFNRPNVGAVPIVEGCAAPRGTTYYGGTWWIFV